MSSSRDPHLHAMAVLRIASRTMSSVEQQLHVQANAVLPGLPLLLGYQLRSGVRDSDGTQRVDVDHLVVRRDAAVLAVVYLAVVAVMSNTDQNIHVALLTCWDELRSIGVVQMV